MQVIYWGQREVTRNSLDATGHPMVVVADQELWDRIHEPGEIELYWATEDGAELLSDDVNVDLEFEGDYDSIAHAIESIQWRGRGYLSTPEDGKYTHRVVSTADSIQIKPL